MLTTLSAQASPLDEPEFGEMVAASNLIVLARVVESTPFYSRARSVETFKGQAPISDFIVMGHNNTCWPKADRDREALAPQTQYLLFLQPIATERSFDTASSWAACGGEPILPKPWRTLPRYAVPVPTMGDYRVEARGIASDSRFCSSCAGDLRVPTNLGFTLIRALAQPNEAELVADARALSRRELTVELVNSAATDLVAKTKLAWLLEGQATFGMGAPPEPLLLAANSPQSDVRQVAVRALPTLGATTEVMQVLDGLLKACQAKESDTLQVEATRALVKLDPTGRIAVDRILSALPHACASEAVHRNGSDPADHPWVSAREVMVRSLTQFRAIQAEPTLLWLLRDPDNAPGTLDAIMTHFWLFRSARATAELLHQYANMPIERVERFNRYFIDVREPKALQVMFGRMLHESVSIDKAYTMLRYYAMHSPPGDQQLEKAVQQLLTTHAGQAELCYLSPLAISLKSDSLIRQLLEFDPTLVQDMDAKTRERIARAVQLQRSAPQNRMGLQRAWLQLLIDDRWTGYATPFFFREFVCNAPASMQPELRHSLEQEQLTELVTSLGRYAQASVTEEPPIGNASFSPPTTAGEFSCFPSSPLATSTALPPRVTGTVTVALPSRSGCGA
ncbi:MAG TPA: hypothetical protein VIV60_23565, partial [Polyangiaceae bacterium]